MEGLWVRERPPNLRRAKARAIFGKAVAYLGFFAMGVLAIPALLCAGLIYLVWITTNALAGRIEKRK